MFETPRYAQAPPSRTTLQRPALGGEEMAHSTPDVVEIVQSIAAGRATSRCELPEQAPGLRRELTRQARGYFDISSKARVSGDRGETRACIATVTHCVVTIGGIEEIDVATSRVVASSNDLPHLVEAHGRDGAPRTRDLKELGFAEFPRFGGMSHEHGLEGAVLAPQTLHDPEKECLRELSIAIGHAARDVEQEEHDGMHGGLSPAGELSIAQVLIDEARRRAGRAAPFHHLLEGAAAIEPRARAATIPPLPYPVGFLRWTDARLQVGKLHLLPEPIHDVVDLELEKKLDLALVLTARAFLTGAALTARIGEHISGLGFALPRALLLLGATQPEMVMLEHAHGDAHGTRALVDDITAGNNLRKMLANGLAHLLVVSQPIARPSREQLVPLGRIRRTGLVAALGHAPFVLLSCATRNSPCGGYQRLREEIMSCA